MKKTIKGISLIISCLLFFFPSSSLASPKFNGTIVEYGIFNIEKVKEKKTDTVGYWISAKEVLIKQTDSIMAKLNTDFGCRYIIADLNNIEKLEPEVIEVTIKWTFPEQGLTDPKNGKTFHTYEKKRGVIIGKTHFDGLTFEEMRDLVPGIWRMQIFYKGDLLAEKSFNVFLSE